MINRLIIKELELWKVRPNRKPLILRGARQVGKTTLVKEFSKKYAIFLKLNLEIQEDKKLFEQYENIEELIKAIYLQNKVIIETKRLLIHTEMTVTEIADFMNFTDQSYFTKYFKKACGLTPLQYRKAKR